MEILFVEKIPWAVLHLIYSSHDRDSDVSLFLVVILLYLLDIIFLTFHFNLPKHYQWTLELHQNNKYQEEEEEESDFT